MSSTIQGYVRHAIDGNTLASARVTLDTLGAGAPLRVLTDDAGWFAFRDLNAGHYRISAHGSPAQEVLLDPFSTLTLELSALSIAPAASGIIAGKVIAANTGFPIENASVMLISGAAPAPDIAPITNAAGEFMFAGLATGAWTLRAVSPDGLAASLRVNLSANQATRVTIAIGADETDCVCRQQAQPE